MPSKKSRSAESERLLDWGFREYDNYRLFRRDETVTKAKIWMGDRGTVPLLIQKDLVLTLSHEERRTMKVKVIMDSPVAAPVK